MAKPPKRDEVKDEPGAEDRFLRGVRKALKTPPKPHTRKGSSEDIKDDGASRSRKRS